jgi:hypothetical protein
VKNQLTKQSSSRAGLNIANTKPANWPRNFIDDPILDEYEAELVDLARLLSQSADVEPSLALRQNARRQLLQKLSARPLPVSPPRPSWFRKLWDAWHYSQISPRMAVAWLLIIVFSLTTLFSTGVVYGSAQALPGQTLYPVKLGLEDWQMQRVSDSDSVTLAHFHLTFADRRLDEMDQLLLLGEPAAIPTAIERYIYHASQTETLLSATAATPQTSPAVFADLFALSSSVQETFSQNELLLIEISRRSRPENWANLNRALSATSDGREMAQTILLNITPNSRSAVRLHIQFADGRLALAGALTDTIYLGDLNRTLADYSEQIEKASALLAETEMDAVLMTEWETALNRQEIVLQEIAQRAPVPASAAIAHARTVSQKGRQVVKDIQSGALPSPGGGPPEDRPGGGRPEDKPGGGRP